MRSGDHQAGAVCVQVCILIDPSLTLAETTTADDSSGDGGRKGPGYGSSSGGGGGSEAPLGNEVDTKKLVQVGPMGNSAHIPVVQMTSITVQGAALCKTDTHCVQWTQQLLIDRTCR